MHRIIIGITLTVIIIGSGLIAGSMAAKPAVSQAVGKLEVRLASELQWEQLNPARGDASPQAADVWGNRKEKLINQAVADMLGTSMDETFDPGTGFLVKFVDGFESPPHIHNVSYRGVVISGKVHNDDPDAKEMWMPAGSYWTQPAGEVHITSAKGKENIAYIEIDSGPYLVKPATEAFDNGERPVNIDQKNIVWLDAANSSWIERKGPQLAHLWGKPQGGHLHGSLIKLPSGFNGSLTSHGLTLRAVVIAGELKHHGQPKGKALTPGSYFSSKGAAKHHLSTAKETVVYIRTDGKYKVSN